MFGGRRFLATLVSLVALLGVTAGSCGDDTGEEAERATAPAEESTTTSEAPTTTTEAAPEFEALPADPALTPEEQVEAAYLHSWDIYLDAVGRGDTKYLDLVYADVALETVTEEVESLVAEGHRARGAPEHRFEITFASGDELGVVWDRYINHLTLVDAKTGDPLEDDPNSESFYDFTMMLREGVWYVVAINKA